MEKKISISDPDFVKRLLSGDSEAEQAFFDYCNRKIRIYFNRSLSSISLQSREDLLSIVVKQALINIRNGLYKPERGSIESYIFGIASNKRKNLLTEYNKRNKIFQDSETTSEVIIQPNDSLEQQELANFIANLLDSIPGRYREVVYLRYFEKKTIQEISDVTGLEKRRVSERINYAIKLLKKTAKKEKKLSILSSFLGTLL